MRKQLNTGLSIALVPLVIILMTYMFSSCSSADGNNPGHEYMMDMGHSVSYEANMYDEFYYNRWDPEQYYKLSAPRSSVPGTIPRGEAGIHQYYTTHIPEKYVEALQDEEINGSVPYYYGDTEEERQRAIKEIINNPLPITKQSLANGKELFDVDCAICHGPKADGNGYLVRDGGKFPAQPANLVSDDFISSSNGRFYHAIMHGKNVMSSYADRLSYTERWEVIQYIRSLQAAAKGKVYNETENTLNTTDKVGASINSAPTSSSNGSETTVIHVGMTVDSTKSSTH